MAITDDQKRQLIQMAFEFGRVLLATLAGFFGGQVS